MAARRTLRSGANLFETIPGPVRGSRRANSGHDQDPDAAQFEQEASGTLRSLGVVRVPLPEFAS
jgi:hypothetical protein